MSREKGQSRETGKHWEYKTQDENTQTKNTSLYTNYINKIWTLLQTTGGKHEPEIVITINILYKWV